jgi:hypothetical protein
METTKVKMKIQGETRTHILNPCGGGEHSLCGYQLVETDEFCDMEYLGETDGRVTCKNCLDVVEFCKAL